MPKIKSESTTLDTLEVTSDYYKSKSHQSLYNNALRKSSTIATLKRLIDVSDKQQQKKYWKAWHCQRVLLQDGNNLKGSLCRKRWCQTCNRIKTAEQINGYHKPLLELQDKENLYFVTLTAPTIEGRKLASEIKKRYKAFVRVKDNLRKNYGIKLIGIRKLEITYNESTKKYHPHFHFIQQGKRESELLQALWLEQFPKANIKAQDIRLVDASNPANLLEVFKYAVKQDIKNEVTAKATNTIYKALEGKRTIQTYGKLRKVKEVKEAISNETKADFITAQQDIWIYDTIKWDWINSRYQELIDTKEIYSAIELKVVNSALKLD